MPITTALYAGLLGFVAIALGVQAGRLRGRLNRAFVALAAGFHQQVLGTPTASAHAQPPGAAA